MVQSFNVKVYNNPNEQMLYTTRIIRYSGVLLLKKKRERERELQMSTRCIIPLIYQTQKPAKLICDDRSQNRGFLLGQV